jgi:hypothetical protein
MVGMYQGQQQGQPIQTSQMPFDSQMYASLNMQSSQQGYSPQLQVTNPQQMKHVVGSPLKVQQYDNQMNSMLQQNPMHALQPSFNMNSLSMSLPPQHMMAPPQQQQQQPASQMQPTIDSMKDAQQAQQMAFNKPQMQMQQQPSQPIAFNMPQYQQQWPQQPNPQLMFNTNQIYAMQPQAVQPTDHHKEQPAEAQLISFD